jgi:hypothetical protein
MTDLESYIEVSRNVLFCANMFKTIKDSNENVENFRFYVL